ncbi:MAG: hypothetical protein RMX96_23060 [Nostoc sp. ChiSLP02]|nr:hypothetical protein [Nostoc sp. DedSLP05]MDZ8103271.1 hypothetical protein [Nostoc sp. DedSLP01]MDZ8187718.1 hypothetical protein [Nostoc sp. ChiSLP02]
MKLVTLINSAFIVASIAFIHGIAGAQTATNNDNNQPINTAINSKNLPNHLTKTSYLKPFNAAFLAYQGGLEDQGIPSGSALITQYQTGNLSTLDVVKAAIKANKVSPEALNNSAYLSGVESQLTSFARYTSY